MFVSSKSYIFKSFSLIALKVWVRAFKYEPDFMNLLFRYHPYNRRNNVIFRKNILFLNQLYVKYFMPMGTPFCWTYHQLKMLLPSLEGNYVEFIFCSHHSFASLMHLFWDNIFISGYIPHPTFLAIWLMHASLSKAKLDDILSNYFVTKCFMHYKRYSYLSFVTPILISL